MNRRGQSLVEFALVMPLLLFTFLAMGEAAFLFSTRHTVQTAADALAQIAAERMTRPDESWNAGWNGLVAEEAAEAHCDLVSSTVIFPDETHGPGDRVRVALRCRYNPTITQGLWPGLIIEARGTAVVRS